ncbi:MAG: glutamine synthetase III [Clostridia bacterium]|nr:glutamine synthetase III [Clostridia bacterium]
MDNISNYFGANVFGDSVMKERLPEETYNLLRNAAVEGKSIDNEIANTVALAMKEWAIEKGATHYTHWFQPMTGITAEKHDSFIAPTDDGHIIMEFSGKELIKGEPDASSFPSGGLRATFEARGYTAWDPSSYAFIKDNTLCIPTAFCSYGGEALDQKTPLLRSMDAIEKQALRIVKLFGMTDVKSVRTTAGPEQEYFLIDKELWKKRPDLVFCGRTLMGAVPPKGQEMNDHYFGVIKPRVSEFMKELDDELWKLGVLAKTEHNEAAPAQHELAPVFTTTNIAADHNQLTMELMKKIADKHGLVCLLAEKPFKGVNGSGKHNNWSMATDTGVNLLSPGKNPRENLLFLLCLVAVIKAVDKHQDLLRISVATAGNDHRLGGAEAPPTIISMYLGDELTEILEDIENGTSHENRGKTKMNIGTEAIPEFKKDNTDRNRTSPFAFTGNKFEFRMLGSASSISDTNVMLNTMMTDVLKEFADRIENAKDFETEVREIIRESFHNHKRIVFNGDGYSEKWQEEAAKRGLLNLKSTPDAIPYLLSDENISLFTRYGIFNNAELRCRADISLENYSKIVHIEALTLGEMVKRDVMPAISKSVKDCCKTLEIKTRILGGDNLKAEKAIIKTLSDCYENLFDLVTKLDLEVEKAQAEADILKQSGLYNKSVLMLMEEIRAEADKAETLVPRENWPYPTYGDLLFNV